MVGCHWKKKKVCGRVSAGPFRGGGVRVTGAVFGRIADVLRREGFSVYLYTTSIPNDA